VVAAGGGDVGVAVEFQDPDGEVPDRGLMIADARAASTDPGGHVGAATGSSAAGFNPSAGASESHFPDPPAHDPTHKRQPLLPAVPGIHHHRRTAAADKRSLLDGGEDRRTLFKPGTATRLDRGEPCVSVG